MTSTRRTATFRDSVPGGPPPPLRNENRRGYLQASLHGQRKHTIIVGRARFTRDRQPTPATTDLAGEPLFDVLLLGDVAL
jgi:hypothetical protein